MASGDKPIDGWVMGPLAAEQGVGLFTESSPFSNQGVFQGEGVNAPSGATKWARVTVHMAASSQAGVPDFDVEKQYKLTIEEV